MKTNSEHATTVDRARLIAAHAIAICSTAYAAATWSAPGDGGGAADFSPFVYINSTYEDNIFRKADFESTTNGQEDIVTRMGGGASVDLPISRQRLQGKVKAERASYKVYSGLNSSSASADGKWSWVIGDLADGSLGVAYDRGLSTFEEQQEVVADIQTQRVFKGQLGMQLIGPTSVQLDASTGKATKSIRGFLDRDTDSFAAELRWHLSEFTYVGARQQVARTDFIHPTLIDTNDDLVPDSLRNSDSVQKISGVVFSWVGQTKTTVSAMAGKVKHDYNEASFEDSSGTIFDGSLFWPATERLSFDTGVQKSLRLRDDASGDSEQRGIRLRPSWAVTERITLTCAVAREHDEYPKTPERTDDTTRLMAGATFEPFTGLVLNASANRDARESTVDASDFIARSYSIGASYKF